MINQESKLLSRRHLLILQYSQYHTFKCMTYLNFVICYENISEMTQ